MKQFFNYLRMPVTITTRLAGIMGWITLLIASYFDSFELLGVAVFLFVVSGDSNDETPLT